MSDFEPEDPRLTVVCTDGTTIGCANFTAKNGGVLLTEDLKRNRVFGFVPNDRVRFVLPTDRVQELLREEETAETAEADEFEDPLMRLPGLGSTYAKRLRSSGYATIEDVAGADPAVLADETGANEERTRKWVRHAETEADDVADVSLGVKSGGDESAGDEAENGRATDESDEATDAGEEDGEGDHEGSEDGEDEHEEGEDEEN